MPRNLPLIRRRSGKIVVAFLFVLFMGAFAALANVRSQTFGMSVGQDGLSNPYANSNSQAVADWVVNNMYNAQVNMLATDPSPGCVDSNAGVTNPCADTFWTTSDNLPTCATLIDFGYGSISQACINKILGCNSVYVPLEWQTSTCPSDPLNFEFTSTGIPASSEGTWLSGWRYEAFLAIPIPIGAPGDQHFIVQTGSLSNGHSYAIKADIATLSIGAQSFSGPVDVVSPQCINEYLRGNLALSEKCANALIGTWDGSGVGGGSGSYSTWQLGQVMFVMRVLGLDTNSSSVSTRDGTMSYSAVFNAMEAKLWAVQAAYTCPVGGSGCLPNSYNSSNQGSGGTDAENQDAGLLPFSASVIDYVRNSFGECSNADAPPGSSSSNLCQSPGNQTSTTTTGSSSSSSTPTTSSTTASNSSSSSSSIQKSTTITSTVQTTTVQSTIDSTENSVSNLTTLQATSAPLVSTATVTTSQTSLKNPLTALYSSPNHPAPARVQTAAMAMGTGSGAAIMLGGLFPLSYLFKNDLKYQIRVRQNRRRRVTSQLKNDAGVLRVGRPG